uniref:F-box domain-containing protein n=1 Tax=Rhizophagus irregularis (strain DAOM 181602 / DAOM 197198 / MUCL 43194) TaxID=747089 RepID=U9UG19_RHIID
MSISKLPNECLQEIFSYIDRVKTLYSIILVNRKWCQNGVIRLWRKPFRNISKIDQVMTFLFIILRVITFKGANIKRFIINLKDRNVNMFFDNDDTFGNKWDITKFKLENTLTTFLSMDATKRCLKNLRYFPHAQIFKGLRFMCSNYEKRRDTTFIYDHEELFNDETN